MGEPICITTWLTKPQVCAPHAPTAVTHSSTHYVSYRVRVRRAEFLANFNALPSPRDFRTMFWQPTVGVRAKQLSLSVALTYYWPAPCTAHRASRAPWPLPLQTMPATLNQPWKSRFLQGLRPVTTWTRLPTPLLQQPSHHPVLPPAIPTSQCP